MIESFRHTPERLQVNFDVSGLAKSIKGRLGIQKKFTPVDCFGQWVVVKFADLIQVDEFVSRMDEPNSSVRVQDGLKAHPCFQSDPFGHTQGLDPFGGQSRSGFPLQRLLGVVQGEGRRPDAIAGLEDVCVPLDGPRPPLGQDLGPQTVGRESFKGLAGYPEFLFHGLVHVARETEQNRIGVPGDGLCLFGELGQDARAGADVCFVGKCEPIGERGARGKTVFAGVRASLVEVGGQGAVFTGFPTGFVDDRHLINLFVCGDIIQGCACIRQSIFSCNPPGGTSLRPDAPDAINSPVFNPRDSLSFFCRKKCRGHGLPLQPVASEVVPLPAGLLGVKDDDRGTVHHGAFGPDAAGPILDTLVAVAGGPSVAELGLIMVDVLGVLDRVHCRLLEVEVDSHAQNGLGGFAPEREPREELSLFWVPDCDGVRHLALLTKLDVDLGGDEIPRGYADAHVVELRLGQFQAEGACSRGQVLGVPESEDFSGAGDSHFVAPIFFLGGKFRPLLRLI